MMRGIEKVRTHKITRDDVIRGYKTRLLHKRMWFAVYRDFYHMGTTQAFVTAIRNNEPIFEI